MGMEVVVAKGLRNIDRLLPTTSSVPLTLPPFARRPNLRNI